MYGASALLPGLAMSGMTRPKPVVVPNLICDNLNRYWEFFLFCVCTTDQALISDCFANSQARVATLMYRDSGHGGSRAEGAMALMKSIARQKQKAAAMGCPVPKGI